MTDRRQRNITPELRDIPLTWMDCQYRKDVVIWEGMAAEYISQHCTCTDLDAKTCWWLVLNGYCKVGYGSIRGYAR